MRVAPTPDYVIVPRWEPSGEACAEVVGWVLALFGDPRDHPVGVEHAVRADVVREILRRGVEVAFEKFEIFDRATYQKMQADYEERIERGTAENRRLVEAVNELRGTIAEDRRAHAKATAELLEMRVRLEDEEKRTIELRNGYFERMEKAEVEVAELRALVARLEGSPADLGPAPL